MLNAFFVSKGFSEEGENADEMVHEESLSSSDGNKKVTESLLQPPENAHLREKRQARRDGFPKNSKFLLGNVELLCDRGIR